VLRLYPIGTEVEIRGGVVGWISAVCVRAGESVCYEVRWWDHSTLHEHWFDRSEIIGRATSRPMRIGFDA